MIELQTILNSIWKKLTGETPRKGDLLPHEEHLYQLRMIGTSRVGWHQVCLLEQPNVENAIVWEVGNSFISADAPNLIATLIDLNRHDSRSSYEDLVSAIFKVVSEAGWVQLRGTKMDGTVILVNDIGRSTYKVTNASSILDQLRSGVLFVEAHLLKEEKNVVLFINPANWDKILVELKPTEEDSES